ncbi:MAG: CAP domain-containing protein [Alphaproteobacteria bacterium]
MILTQKLPDSFFKAPQLMLLAIMWLILLFSASHDAAANQDYVTLALTRINQERTQQGIKPLTLTPTLSQAAGKMAVNALAVKSNNGTRPLELNKLLRDLRYPVTSSQLAIVGTNSAPETHVNNWLTNAKSRKIFLNPDMVDIGIYAAEGVIQDQNNQGVLWAALVGKPSKPTAAGWQSGVQYYVNQFRAQYGLQPLALNPRLNQVSQDFSRRMAVKDFVAHEAPEGDRVDTRVSRSGYQWQRVLENLQGGAVSDKEAVDAWIASKKGHREAMLEPNITQMGIGYYYMPFDDGNARYTHYWTLVMAIPK